jgi:hypothetical protein
MNPDPAVIAAAMARIEALRLAVEQTEFILQRIEGARSQFSSAADELLGLYRDMRARTSWLIQELDILRADLHLALKRG